MKREENIEMRYYEIPHKQPLIALLGERWELNYGADPLHIHNCMEIGFCYYGEGTMFFGKEEREYHPGTITVIPMNFPHRTQSKEASVSKWEFLFVDVNRFLEAELIENPVQSKLFKQCLNNCFFMISEQEAPDIGRTVRLILDEMRGKKEYYKEIVKGYLLSLLLEIIRQNPIEDMENSSMADSRNTEHIMEVLNYIEEHYQDELKIGDLAEICHMSESHFRRVFTACMNVPPLEYVTLVRIQRACELLSDSQESLDNIGRKVGFQVVASFIRNFKKLIGISPGQWRNMIRQKDNILVNYRVSVHKGW